MTLFDDRFIYFDDLMRFLPDEEALKTLNVVEGSTEKERISKASLKNWVVRNKKFILDFKKEKYHI